MLHKVSKTRIIANLMDALRAIKLVVASDKMTDAEKLRSIDNVATMTTAEATTDLTTSHGLTHLNGRPLV